MIQNSEIVDISEFSNEKWPSGMMDIMTIELS